MVKSIRISDDLYSMAQNVSLALGRPLAQQMEYWARLGVALDAAGISTGVAMELLGNGAKADEFIAIALGREAAPEDGGLPMLKERQRKDAVEVAAERKSARSFLMFQKSDLKRATSTENPASEFNRKGDGW